jgi:hypothetical protein
VLANGWNTEIEKEAVVQFGLSIRDRKAIRLGVTKLQKMITAKEWVLIIVKMNAL